MVTKHTMQTDESDNGFIFLLKLYITHVIEVLIKNTYAKDTANHKRKEKTEEEGSILVKQSPNNIQFYLVIVKSF